MVVYDLLKVFKGEIRVVNKFYDDAEVGIINTKYQGWVKVSYMNCEVEEIKLEMLNTAVLSARMIIYINDEGAGLDPGDVEEATKQDIDDIIDNLYVDSDDNGMTEDEETIRVITETYYDHEPLPGDENDFGDGCADEDDGAVEDMTEQIYNPPEPLPEPEVADEPVVESPTEDDEEGEATEDDIMNLLGGLYSE